MPDLPPTIRAAGEIVSEFPLKPTLAVHSGYGLHLYWLFREPWCFETAEERRQAQALVRAFQSTMRALAAARSWHPDATHDLSRVLRVPGTMNRKREPRPVRVIRCVEERRYLPSDFEEYVEPFAVSAPAPRVRIAGSGWEDAVERARSEASAV